MPLYLHIIGLRVYGAWLGSGEVLAWMLAFDFGIPNLMIQRIGAAHSKGDHAKVGEYFGTGAATLLTLAVILGLAVAGVSPFVGGWMKLSLVDAVTLGRCFALGGIATAITILNYCFLGLSRGVQDTFLVNFANLVGTIVGFGATVFMILHGYGLYAIAGGLLIRASVGLLGSFAFFFGSSMAPMRRSIRFSGETAREFAKISPSMFLSGLGYLVMSNSQMTIAAVMLGPELAAVFGITRKAADLGKALLDMVGYAAYGGFAHLHAASNARRTRDVYDEIISTYLTIAIALMSAYVAVNPSLISVWVTPAMFGGPVVTVLIAAAMVISGWSYLTISLYRSSGGLVQSSVALLIECAVRVPLMILLTHWFGLIGLPMGTLVTASISGVWGHLRVIRDLPAQSHPEAITRVWAVRGVMFAAVVAICPLVMIRSWAFVLGGGVLVVVVTTLILLRIDPMIHAAWRILNGRTFGRRAKA